MGILGPISCCFGESEAHHWGKGPPPPGTHIGMQSHLAGHK